MKNITAILFLITTTMVGCRKSTDMLPNNTRNLVQGEWTLTKMKAKTWIGNMRVGGQTKKLDIEVLLQMESDSFTFLDDAAKPQMMGTYNLNHDSIIFFNELDTTEAPGRFRIQKLNDYEMELITTQDTTTRFGEAHTEAVYYYER